MVTVTMVLDEGCANGGEFLGFKSLQGVAGCLVESSCGGISSGDSMDVNGLIIVFAKIVWKEVVGKVGLISLE